MSRKKMIAKVTVVAKPADKPKDEPPVVATKKTTIIAA